jgi:plasmid rolling circle replication initiator protein Rep
MDKSNDGILCPIDNDAQVFLTDLVADDNAERQKKHKKEKRQNWDTRKIDTVQVGDILASGEERHQRQAQRMNQCAELLFFEWLEVDANGEIKLGLRKACFCRVRHCPICQWRRSQMWVARFFQALPLLYAAYPTVRYVLLTLTVKNCPITELRPTVQTMNAAWRRLSNRKTFPALGFVRSLEVTKETDTYDKKTKKLIHKARPNYCHPHFHILLALPSSYFGRNYLTTADWVKLWRESLRVDYNPICDIRIVKAKKTALDAQESDFEAILDQLDRVKEEAAKNGLDAVLAQIPHLVGYVVNADLMTLITELQALAQHTTEPPLDALKTALNDALSQAQSLHNKTVIGSLQAAILETLKYTVKPADLTQDRDWTLALVDQLHKSRAVALGGIFKEFLKEEDDESSPDQEETANDETAENKLLYFGWRQPVKRYQQLAPRH